MLKLPKRKSLGFKGVSTAGASGPTDTWKKSGNHSDGMVSKWCFEFGITLSYQPSLLFSSLYKLSHSWPRPGF